MMIQTATYRTLTSMNISKPLAVGNSR